MTNLGPITLDKIITTLPVEVVTALKEHTCYLAGGFIRAIVADEKVSDIDLFVPSQLVADELTSFFARIGCGVHVSGNSVTLRGLSKPVQIITRWTYNTPTEVVNSFDYTLAQACVYWVPQSDVPGALDGYWQSTVADTFEDDVINRRLVYTAPIRVEEQAGSLFRLFKFYKRGYSVSLETLAKVIARATSGGAGYVQMGESVVAGVLLGDLKKAGRYLPKPPNPADYYDEPELVAGDGTGMGGTSSC